MKTPFSIPVFLLAGLLAAPLAAHEGHDHGDPAAPATAPGPSDAPRRLPDGRLRVSKASQHLWGLRTQLAPSEVAAASMELAGRVVADPSASGRVQAPFAGVIEAEAGGLLLPGQTVKAGQVLAWLRPALSPMERSARLSERADVEARLRTARQKAERLQQLDGSVARKEIDAARAEADGLARQFAALGSALEQREALRAPVAGVLTAVSARLGQRVEAGAELFQVLRPDRLMVEALAYDPAVLSELGAVGTAARGDAGGVPLRLRFAGADRSLREGSLPLLFRVDGAPPVAIGQPVKVFARLGGVGAAVVVLPLAAVTGSGDQARVWVHERPEIFAPRAVQITPLDGERVRVSSGVAAGERVVVQGAQLLGGLR